MKSKCIDTIGKPGNGAYRYSIAVSRAAHVVVYEHSYRAAHEIAGCYMWAES